MTNQEWLSSISPAECYKAMNWLLNVYGKQFTSTEVAIIQWLEGDAPGDIEQLMIYKTLFRLEHDMNPNKKEYDAFKKYCEERVFEFALPAQVPIERRN